MKLFKSDLFRNFAIGFAAGAVIIALQSGPDLFQNPIPPAHAAPAPVSAK
jgi:hypothetical protein